jgi:hypothetical protein
MAAVIDRTNGMVTLAAANDEIAETVIVDCLVAVCGGVNGTATLISSGTQFSLPFAVLANGSIVIPFGNRGKRFPNGLKLSAVSGLTIYAMLSKAGR